MGKDGLGGRTSAPRREIHVDPVRRTAAEQAVQVGQNIALHAGAGGSEALQRGQNFILFSGGKQSLRQHEIRQEANAAVSAPGGIDGDAGGGERVQVPAHRPGGDLQLLRQLGNRHTVSLQETVKNFKQACALHAFPPPAKSLLKTGRNPAGFVSMENYIPGSVSLSPGAFSPVPFSVCGYPARKTAKSDIPPPAGRQSVRHTAGPARPGRGLYLKSPICAPEGGY
ncbi:hypothetical protein SDC9_130901 [bioreactor metagenome]|uniref:Uncharacterized protein n=1 Tax=bioreactor metagenome TaxID=1076179 RepID=A0A645D5C7_9ZZZZ